jgi:hypothetical protein
MGRRMIPKDYSRKKSLGLLTKTAIAFIVVASLAAGIWYLNRETGLLEDQLARVERGFEALDSALLSKLTAGISVGAILVLLAVFVLPLFFKKVDSKEYVKNLVLGLVSSFVFYLSQLLYDFIGTRGRVYVAISMLLVAFVTFFIVEVLALGFKSRRKGVEFRTAVLGGIASGLAFGIVLQLVTVGLAAIRSSLRS